MDEFRERTGLWLELVAVTVGWRRLWLDFRQASSRRWLVDASFLGFGRVTTWVDFDCALEVEQGLDVSWWIRHGVGHMANVGLKVMVLVVVVKKGWCVRKVGGGFFFLVLFFAVDSPSFVFSLLVFGREFLNGEMKGCGVWMILQG